MMTTTNNSPNNFNMLLLLAAIGVGVITITYIRSCKKDNDTETAQISFINSLSDSVKVLKMKDSSQKATISSLVMTSDNSFINLLSYDSAIIALQGEVRKYKNKLKAGSAVVIGETDTNLQDSGKTIVITKVDTLYKDGSNNIITYQYSHKDKWINYTMLMTKDTSKLHLSVINKYAVVLGYNKKKPFVDVINYNPYSSTRILRSYQVSLPKEKMWGVGFSSGVSIGTGLKVQPYLGFGINYNIIQF